MLMNRACGPLPPSQQMNLPTTANALQGTFFGLVSGSDPQNEPPLGLTPPPPATLTTEGVHHPRARPSHPADDTLYASTGEDQSYGEGGNYTPKGRSLLA